MTGQAPNARMGNSELACTTVEATPKWLAVRNLLSGLQFLSYLGGKRRLSVADGRVMSDLR